MLPDSDNWPGRSTDLQLPVRILRSSVMSRRAWPCCVHLGSPYYDNVRPLCYSDSDAVLLCFDISRPDTIDEALKKVAAPLLQPAGGAFHKGPCHLFVDFNLLVAVESRDPGLLPQHTDPADRLQDWPPHGRLHAHRAVQSEADANFPWTG